MRPISTIGIALCLTIATSCAHTGDNASRCVQLQLNDYDQPISMTDIMEPESWISLETTEESGFIGNAARIEKYDGNYFILDSYNQQCVLVFDANGHFLNKIGSVGGGPGEYAMAQDFTINREKGTVDILSSNSTLYRYDTSGKFIKSYSFISDYDPENAAHMTAIKSDGKNLWASTTFASGGNSPDLLYCYDNEMKLTGKWMPYENAPIGFSPFKAHFQLNDTDLFYVDNIHLKVYACTAATDNLAVPYELTLPNPVPEEIWSDPMYFMEHQLEYGWLYDTAFAGEHILAIYLCSGAMRLAIFDKNGTLLKSGSLKGMVQSYNTSPDGTFISPISPESYEEEWANRTALQPESRPTDDTNLLLLIWRLKI